jgi:hypothetical protein
MSVTVKQEFYVSNIKPEFGDVSLNLRRGFDEAAIDNKVSVWGCDKKRGDFDSTDIIEVARDPEWWDGLVPGAAGWVCLTEDPRGGDEDKQKRK